MASLALIRESKESFPLIEIDFGSTTIYATTTKSPISWNGNTYWPEPTIEVKLPKQSGGLSEDPCVVTLPLNRNLHAELQAMAVQLSKPRSAPDTEIRIINLLKGGEEEFQPIYLYEGIMDRVRRNPEGKRNVLEIEFQTELRYQLKEFSLGRRCDPECDFIYGKTGCFVNNTQFYTISDNYPNHFKKIRRAWVVGTIFDPLSPREITLGFDPVLHPGMDVRALTSQPKGWWVRSYLEKNKTRIPIQEWFYNDALSSGTNRFILNRVPPEDWSGSTLLLVHGCPQRIEDCRDRNNENNFGGLGYGIPAYNPVLEVNDG